MHRGHTLPELATVLLILGMGVSALAPAARSARDRLAVAGAREEVVGLFVRARADALAYGGATLVLVDAEGRGWVEAGDSVTTESDGPRRAGVALAVGGADTVRLRFDALGVGRGTSRTLLFSRGRARASLVVASHGRVSRK